MESFLDLMGNCFADGHAIDPAAKERNGAWQITKRSGPPECIRFAFRPSICRRRIGHSVRADPPMTLMESAHESPDLCWLQLIHLWRAIHTNPSFLFPAFQLQDRAVITSLHMCNGCLLSQQTSRSQEHETPLHCSILALQGL